MKAITNLNLLDTNKLIVDDEDRIFIVLGASCSDRTHTCDLSLIEVNKDFTKWCLTLPIACNKEMEFVSVNEEDWVFKFTQLEVTKEEISKVLRNEVRSIVNIRLLKEKKNVEKDSK